MRSPVIRDVRLLLKSQPIVLDDAKMKSTARRIVAMLLRGDYDALETITDGKRLMATEIAEAVREYGKTLVMPPDIAFEHLDIIGVEGASQRKWSVNMSLRTVEEGRSDLTLELILKDNAQDMYGVEIDGIHVL